MKSERFKAFAALVVALTALMLCVVDVRSQQRNRPSRRATNPVRARAAEPAPTPLPSPAPDSNEPRLVHSAEDAAAQDETPRRRTTRTSEAARRAAAEQTEREQMRDTVDKLNTTVTKLSEEVTQLKGEQRILVDLERLTRAEQRAENLRSQLRDVTDKEFALQERAMQIEEELEPDAIERRAALIGSLNPSAVRDGIRRALEREKERIQRQLEMLGTSRVRLESAVASADNEVERIKARIEAAERDEGTDAATRANTNPVPAPTRTTTDTPPPAEPPQE